MRAAERKPIPAVAVHSVNKSNPPTHANGAWHGMTYRASMREADRKPFPAVVAERLQWSLEGDQFAELEQKMLSYVFWLCCTSGAGVQLANL